MIFQRSATIPSTARTVCMMMVADVSIWSTLSRTSKRMKRNKRTSTRISSNREVQLKTKETKKKKKNQRKDVSRWFNDHQNIKYYKCSVHCTLTSKDRPSTACSDRCIVYAIRTRTHRINFLSNFSCDASEHRVVQPSRARAYIPLFGCVRIAIHFCCCWISHGSLWQICTIRNEIPNVFFLLFFFSRTNWNQLFGSERKHTHTRESMT